MSADGVKGPYMSAGCGWVGMYPRGARLATSTLSLAPIYTRGQATKAGKRG